MTVCLFASFLILLALNTPISIALGVAAAGSLLLYSDVPVMVVAQQMSARADTFVLLAIPFFVFAGELMRVGGASKRLIDLASALVGWVRGGLGLATVLASMLFAGVSGSTAADTAAIGSLLIPALVAKGYGRGPATAIQATAGSIAIVIPPSIPFILMGVIGRGMPVDKLFWGGTVPGILVGLGLMAAVWAMARLRAYPAEPRRTPRELLRALARGVPTLFTFVIILGGIRTGLVTATEAGVLAVAYALVLGGLVYRELPWKEIPSLLVHTAAVTGVVVLCIATSSAFGWVMTAEELPPRIARAFLGLSDSPTVRLLLINLLLLVIGTVLDLTPAAILFVPLLQPIACGAPPGGCGMDPVHFGVIVVMNLAIGQCTPPVGISLFVAAGISKARMGEVAVAMVPYLIAMIAVLLLCTFVPPLVMWLPGAVK